jgi:hypothetical protein
VDTETGEVGDIPGEDAFPCDRWTCSVCGPRKCRRCVAHYTHLFVRLPAPTFVTLTVDPKCGLDPERSRRFVVELFSRFRKRLNRAVRAKDCRQQLHYVATIEHQRATGQAHLHAVLSAPGLSGDEIAEAWFECGGGAAADAQPLGSADDCARHVGYALKYALKDALASPVAGRRYVLASQGDGYYSEPAKEARRAYVASATGEPVAPAGADVPTIGGRFIPLWIPTSANRPRGNPDRITEEDRAHFAALDLSARSTAYRWRDPRTTRWWLIEQDAGGRRRTPLPRAYRSLAEARMHAADAAARARLVREVQSRRN